MKNKKVKGRRNLPSKEEIAKDLKSSTQEEEVEERIPELPEEERQCVNAKMYLMKQSARPNSGNLYEHLSRLLTNILDQDEPEETITELEDISYQLKQEKLPCPTPIIRPTRETTMTDTLAKSQIKMMQNAIDDRNFRFSDEDEQDDKYRLIPDVMRQVFFYEQAAIGLPREEFIRISVAMRDIVDLWPIESIRFWGKILGLYRNYYVVETDFTEGDYESETSDTEEDEEVTSFFEDQTTDSLFDDISITTETIKPIVKQPSRIPCEALGTGLNKKVYFVCSEPGLPWIRLPHVTPEQIVTARKIKSFFTGVLDSKLVTYPPFPGTERNYLRAQIARITSATTVSPIGYYRFDDEEEGEEESGESGSGRDTCIIDPEFEGMPIRDLSDSQTWCHHMLPILPQGRNVWFNPVEGGQEGEDEDEDDEDRNEPDEPEPEVGPPLLTPISEDQDVGNSPAWITKMSSKFLPEYSLAVLNSNVWPGACAFAAERGKFFENIYIGWGHKNQDGEFQPEIPEATVTEFPSGPEITEADDPSPEQEAAVEAAMQEKEFGMDDDDDDEDGEQDDD